jgi:ABC-type bacteriocin/lantibiotic exporter with double-glycine peptidase domain
MATRKVDKHNMTNNKQQTAVEWLADKIEILHYNYWAEHISKDEKNQRLKQLKEQAKEMEMEQKANTWNNAINAVEKDKWESFEQYYEQTYGGGNK